MIDQLTEQQELDNDSVNPRTPARKPLPPAFLAQQGNASLLPPGGRKIDKRLLKAVVSEFAPEEVGQALREALAIAKSQRSSRGMLEVVRFVVEYGVGAPIKRSISVSSTIEDMLREVMGGVGEANEGDGADSGVVVDGVVGGEHEIGGGEDQEKRGEQDREPTLPHFGNRTSAPSAIGGERE